ncbi:hypothetical protein [Teichococcus oryzae]|uniref:Uncharacterized protein n=1 Tax=Teichococcus oryzae TaxID=1608942 RepID=A0A5B2TEV4_9PROT|nr:hypothetical protein [Pseudoroseomonas oryzae]KAA2212633.1 hypothetical protein F0Q34_13005 [Pseudoroseomonas oryzae]
MQPYRILNVLKKRIRGFLQKRGNSARLATTSMATQQHKKAVLPLIDEASSVAAYSTIKISWCLILSFQDRADGFHHATGPPLGGNLPFPVALKADVPETLPVPEWVASGILFWKGNYFRKEAPRCFGP